MAKLSRLAGSTSHILELYIQDSSKTDGSGLAGLAFNSAGLTAYFKRNTGTASAAVTLATITTLGTYASGGFREVDAANMPGLYEFHPPDAAYASGAKSVVLMLRGATNMAPVLIEVELTAVDNQDGAAFGLSRLDAAVSSRSTYAGGAVASVTAPVSINLTQTGLTARDLGGVADAALTLNDAFMSAICGAAGKETTVGTAYTVKTPSTGTVLRVFTLDDAANPTSRS